MQYKKTQPNWVHLLRGMLYMREVSIRADLVARYRPIILYYAIAMGSYITPIRWPATVWLCYAII